MITYFGTDVITMKSRSLKTCLLQNIKSYKTKVPETGTNKADGPTRQAGQVNRCAHFSANIFAAATEMQA